MGFFKRIFSADYRAAVAAEAAGDFDLAAERYALAGHPEAAVRVHVARADRAERRADEIAALRDALHWSPEEGSLRALISRRLGRAILARARAEGIATSRDRDRVREAAELLVAAGDYERAGAALEEVGDRGAAIEVYRRGGLVERLEAALVSEEETQGRERDERDAYADYELHMRSGERDAALDAIRRATQAASSKVEYRRLQDELESRLITGGRVRLRIRGAPEIVLAEGPEVTLGRDSLCDLVLRTPGVSRRHAQITVTSAGFELSDLGSRNGTRIGDMPLAASVPLRDRGQFALGDQCTLTYEVRGQPGKARLRVTAESSLDAGVELHVIEPGGLASLEVPGIDLRFHKGRPILVRGARAPELRLGGELIAFGDVQLIHGDALVIDGVEVDVE